METLEMELIRMNNRYENNKANPNWDEAMLNVLIAAQRELSELCDKQALKVDFDWRTLPGNLTEEDNEEENR